MPHRLVKEARSLLPPSSPAGMKSLAEVFFSRVPEDDIAMMSPEAMVQMIRNHWELSKARKPGKTALRIYNLKPATKNWSENRTCIDIVNDDMAFLVDSVAAALTRYYKLIHLLLHPILYSENGKKGGDVVFRAQPDDRLTAQSYMHIELQGTVPESLLPQLEKDLRRVLEDVRLATGDWMGVRESLREAQKQLSFAPQGKYDSAEIEEYLNFLEYMYKDNFTLLGCREYRYSEKDGKVSGAAVKGSGLGLLRDDIKPPYINTGVDGLPQDIELLRRDLPPLTVSKINRPSTVHRPVPLDAVVVKQFDKSGKMIGARLFIGLFTSVTYSRSIQDIPLLRQKAEKVTQMSGFRHGSHNYKALRHILEKYPRDELFQIELSDLQKNAISIMLLQERQRIALYPRRDPFDRFISCLVYIPKDRYDTRLRLQFQKILESELQGECGNFYTNLDDSPLARVMFMIYRAGNKPLPKYDARVIEEKLQEAGRLWSERLGNALVGAGENETRVAELVEKYGESFPAAYREHYAPKQAVYDLAKIETVLATGSRFELDLYSDKSCAPNQLRLKVYYAKRPVTLSDALPVLENMGVQVISELPFEISPAGAAHPVWVHDFLLQMKSGTMPEDMLQKVKPLFEGCLAKVAVRECEDDGLNALVFGAGLSWREIVVLRTYVRYLRQTRYPFGARYIEKALTANPAICREIVKLFTTLFDPAGGKNREASAAACNQAIEKLLEGVKSLDEDRTLRAITGLVNVTLRTNFYQTDERGQPKTWLSIKLDSKKIDLLPDPKPFREIFVYSPRMEGVHLRGDWIARGGIRWSDRNEDFRTEVLGLMKAQQVKNAVIVPMGAKGGFVLKNPPKSGGREALQAEGIECYKTLIRGMLDLTDNRKGKKIVPPKNVVRRDPDDYYIVAAADKGTATFSNIANGLSKEYDFWLGDAFASGGSAGYDHKGMGITARGAWESVKRHFREIGHNTQTQAFDVVGVGDMGGDVFGNGMLQSDKIRMIGAFNHLHIVCDPNPDPASSFKERERLFKAVKGWDSYDEKKLSKGGRIYSRSDKSLTLTPEIRARFDLDKDKATPAELIQAMLRARTDLLFFGGIGTFIKSSHESHADAGDRGNDSLRVDAREIRAKVVGEGANLGVTQLARIEYALRGGRINTDFLDNSAGVDTSDHEVNIKILMTEIMNNPAHKMTLDKRNALLASMEDEVARLVLRDNYQQALGISLAELSAGENLAIHARFIRELEKQGALDRRIENLPDEEEIAKRRAAGQGLTRPELCVLLAYAKILFTRELLDSDIPDQEDMKGWLVRYFPAPLCKKYEEEIGRHGLGREIIATTVASALVNRMGPTFVKSVMDRTGAAAADVARAYIIVRETFDLHPLWDGLESLDDKIPSSVQLSAMRDIARMAEREVTWFLTRLGREPDIGRDVAGYGKGIATLHDNLDNVVTPNMEKAIAQHTDKGVAGGLPKDLAHQVALMPSLGAACDIIRISMDRKTDLLLTARTYFELGEYFHIDWLQEQAQLLDNRDRWAAEALESLKEQIHVCQAGLTIRILSDMEKSIKGAKSAKGAGRSVVQSWVTTHAHQAAMLEPVLADMRRSGMLDMAMLLIAVQKLRHLFGG